MIDVEKLARGFDEAGVDQRLGAKRVDRLRHCSALPAICARGPDCVVVDDDRGDWVGGHHCAALELHPRSPPPRGRFRFRWEVHQAVEIKDPPAADKKLYRRLQGQAEEWYNCDEVIAFCIMES